MIKRNTMKSPYLFFKRTIDIAVSIVLLILLSPLLLIVAILNLYHHGRPVLFTQKRPGMNENIFDMYKFRTMTNEKDERGELLADNRRLTSFGNFLRKTSLDELPELFNVLKGDMSLVGPRPLLVKYLPHYSERERKRHHVRPGITGLAQVTGRNSLNWDDRLEKDVEYVENLSFLLDLEILVKTVVIVLQRKDVTLNSLDDFDKYRGHE